jgi:hypothetical protein
MRNTFSPGRMRPPRLRAVIAEQERTARAWRTDEVIRVPQDDLRPAIDTGRDLPGLPSLR